MQSDRYADTDQALLLRTIHGAQGRIPKRRRDAHLTTQIVHRAHRGASGGLGRITAPHCPQSSLSSWHWQVFCTHDIHYDRKTVPHRPVVAITNAWRRPTGTQNPFGLQRRRSKQALIQALPVCQSLRTTMEMDCGGGTGQGRSKSNASVGKRSAFMMPTRSYNLLRICRSRISTVECARMGFVRHADLIAS